MRPLWRYRRISEPLGKNGLPTATERMVGIPDKGRGTTPSGDLSTSNGYSLRMLMARARRIRHIPSKAQLRIAADFWDGLERYAAPETNQCSTSVANENISLYLQSHCRPAAEEAAAEAEE